MHTLVSTLEHSHLAASLKKKKKLNEDIVKQANCGEFNKHVADKKTCAEY